ncbi:piggyBac transposable element-derived protein 4-like [Saccostrea echinata]|uniref:piggyBac transposable element-derived protein 4-like n=1 Tax=Saccostrea echinata TaxID=191078 RepID=UPI002A8216D7|nr:piggyBac transposable element-derived protein 4-like [Saccostrea echinata]
MVENILDIFLSNSNSDEFEGFTEADIEAIERRSIGSDISLSDFEDSSSEEESEEEIDDATWSRQLHKPNVTEFTEEVGPSFVLDEDKKELDFFLKFFPTTLIEKIVEETNGYAARSIVTRPDKIWVPTTIPEKMAFLGIHIIFSVLGVPSYTLAWKSTWPFEIPSIPTIMTRTRFERISKYFHMNDTTQNPARGQPRHDKLCHIRPVIDKLSETCHENYHPHKEQSVNEGMIAFKGRLSFKQYLPAKPTKFEIKVWERASPKNGYVHEFQMYMVREAGGCTEEGLGSRVVKDLTRKLVHKSHVVYMDNFFSSPELYEQLLREGVYCCGTIRVNRRGMPEAIKSAKLKNRGDSLTMQKGNLVATAWKGKKVVTYLSTNCDPTHERIMQRHQKDGTRKDVSAPSVSELYMFGVDLADQKRMQYSTCRKAKKWYKYLFWFCFDLAVNALICMQESPNHKLRTKTNKEKKKDPTGLQKGFGPANDWRLQG